MIILIQSNEYKKNHKNRNKYPGFCIARSALAIPEYNELLTVLADDFEDDFFFENLGLKKLTDLFDMTKLCVCKTKILC